MPREMDFEAKYRARDVGLFDQKNEMFKRARWDPELKQAGKDFYGVINPKGKAGYRHEDISLRNAGWFLEMAYARGVIHSNFGLYSWEDKIQGMSELPEGVKFDSKNRAFNTRIVKKAAKLYGADMVGICKLDRRWIYRKGYDFIKRTEYEIDIPDEYRYVINMAVSMDYEHYKYAPSFSSGGSTGLGYSKMAFTTGLTAQFVRQLGYKAIPSGNDTAISVPYAIQAGLGELGRNGFLITPKFGPRVRLCKIFTDLPLVCDKPMEFGVTEFCDVCKKCAKHCPGQAISYSHRTLEPLNICNSGGTLKWYVDAEKCFKFWAKNGCECGNCIRVCAFNKPDGTLHNISRWFIDKFPRLDNLYVKADDLFGYGKQAELSTFWERND
ncbi:MAG: reductive dehalogenase [Thermodesulfobacteriota bacterium]|nr:reductive dehalogenase [Thermodesulfobacteriota bacterium]